MSDIHTPLAIDAAELVDLRALALASSKSLWEVIETQTSATPVQCLERLSATLRMDALGMDALHQLTPDFSILPFAEAARQGALLVQENGTTFGVLSDPFDLTWQTRLEARLGAPLTWKLAHPADLVAYFAVHEQKLRTMDGVFASIAENEAADAMPDDLSFASIAEDISPVIRLVNSTIFDAMKLAASDIHLETSNSGLSVKYRIDGVLNAVAQFPGLETAEQVVSRVKVMAELDIAERRIPQDGRFKISVNGKPVDFRVSVMPSLFGEDVVIRILDKRSLTDQVQGLSLDLLGFDDDILIRIRRLAKEP
jgi:general secretion pathway protein E